MVRAVGKRRFIIINPFGIGDVLFTTPILRALKENFEDCFIGYLCNQRTETILSNNPFVDKIFALSRGDLMKIFRQSKIKGINTFLSLLRDIKQYKFNCAIDLSLEHRYALMLKLLGVKERVGFDYKRRGRFLTERIEIDGYHNRHIVDYYLDLLKLLNLKCENKKLDLYLTDQEKFWASNWVRTHNLTPDDLIIGISPGGGLSWGKQRYFKIWDVNRFAQLSDRLLKELNAKVVVFGDGDDREACNILAEKAKYPVISCCGKLSLREFISVLSRCNILVTNDGGPLHLAAALGIKTVSIFGPVDDKTYGPYPSDENQHLVVKKSLECQPCYKNFRVPDCEDRKCLDIDVEEVYSAVKRLSDK